MVSLEREQHEAVAIVGMGCRWPGGVRNGPEFWDFLRNKVDGWKEFDDPRFPTRGFHHPNADRPGSMSMKGAFLSEEDARLFDHSFFGMTGLEVETLDPSQRKLLEVAYEAIENAGETWSSVSGTRTGVFVGNFCLDHWMIQSRDWDNPRPYAFTGAGTSILANRISYIFNLQGPSLTVDTACSSSMYALHLAVNAIRAGDCDSAIVASANWIADPGVQIALDKLGALSASSRCHTFDAKAEGYARGEGFGAIYLKRPSLAIADSSPIRAMIRGTAINSNGRTGGITRPSAKGQETVIREAYRNAGDLTLSDTSYFECHGTGTYVGDPIEVAAVGKVFAPDRSLEDPLLVGSVKSNVGHGEGASALASIMKVVLSLENGLIPPIFNLESQNPNIDFEGAKVQPVTEVTPWPKGRLQRASINSFGYGGANGHCILDHVKNVLPGYVAPGVCKDKVNGMTNGVVNGITNGVARGITNGVARGITNGHTNGYDHADSIQHYPITKSPELNISSNAATRQVVLLPFSAHNEHSLKLNIDALNQVIGKFSLADVAYTYAARRSRLAQRSFCIVDKGDVAPSLIMDGKPVRAPLQTSNLGFVFTGQGAQGHAMGAELFEYRVFRTAIEYLDSVLGELSIPPAWSLYSILSGDCDETLIQSGEVSQAACTALQIGLVDLLASWSIRPSGVAGHSSGEIAAAYASGHVTAAEAIVAAYLRGQAVSKNEQKGAMLAVGLSQEQVAKYLRGREDRVRVAAINSPANVTLSGDMPAIDEISTTLTSDGIFYRWLQTDGNAYHSHHMIPVGHEYIKTLTKEMERIQEAGLTDAKSRYQHVSWVSSVTPHKSTDHFGHPASYWRANLESPVRFSEAIANLVGTESSPIHALVEIGPHPALKSPLQEILKAGGHNIVYTATLKRKEDGRRSMLRLAGSLFSVNATVDLVAVNAVDKMDGTGLEHGCTSTTLPPYQYTYGGLNYHESRASKEYRSRSVLRHDLLGSKVAGCAKLRPLWRNILRVKDVPWLRDHRLVPEMVLPGAGYLAMAVEAAARIHDEFPEPVRIKGFSLQEVTISKSLTIPEDDYGVEVLTSMELIEAATGKSPAWATFSISSVGRDGKEWTEHSKGQVKVELIGTDEDDDNNEVGGRLADLKEIGAKGSLVSTRAWYKRFSDIGLGYGPTFRPLSDIRVDPETNVALATVALHTTASTAEDSPGVVKGGESRYPLHPASLDGAIQLGLIACHGGRPKEASAAFVPVQLSSMYLANTIADDSCTVRAHGQRRGIRAAYLDLQMLGPGQEILLSIDALRCVSYSTEAKSVDRAFSSPFTRLVWQPDIRTLSNRQARHLFPPPKENVDKSPHWAITNKLAHFVVLSIYESFGKLQDGPTPSGDVGHFFDWIRRKGKDDRSDLMEEGRQLALQGHLTATIENLVSQASDVMEVKIAKLLHDNMADVLYQRRTGMDVIISQDLLTPLYQSGLLMTGIYPQLFHVLAGIAHANPNLRILEIGGGTGGATRIAMDALNGPNDIKYYQDYTFTDISPGFLSSARESMAGLRDMKFSVFDTEVDPMKQGYEQAYDLVIACQVLHATSDMHKTLSNCRKLLRPGGKLVLVETNRNFTVPGVVVGTFTGYWAGIPDGRIDAPFQSLESWESSLRKAGFSGIDVVLDDFPKPHNTTSVILSTVLPEPPAYQSELVRILHGAKTAPALVEHIIALLRQRGMIAKVGQYDETWDGVAAESRVIALLDERHLLLNASEQELGGFQHLARQAASLIILTSCGTVTGRNAEGSLVPALLRVLRNENPASHYMSIDIDADDFDLAVEDGRELARCIVNFEVALHDGTQAEAEENGFTDREFSWQDGCMWVGRHVPDAGFHAQHGLDNQNMKTELLPLSSQRAVRAAFETAGVLNSLRFVPYNELLQPLASGFIDVAVAAVGLNWRDLDHWSGRLDGNHLSSEYTGTVTAVGANVSGLTTGDRVYGVGRGQFGNYTRVPASFASKLRPGDDMIQMASMPIAYATAVYAFDYVARIRQGQSVLVQSGAQDVGLASIRLARAKGADVFAMVDTTEQASWLMKQMAMPAAHVISTPSLKSLQRTARMTRNGGFDVIMSTAHGDLLHSSCQVLGPLGHLIDVGRVNFQGAPTMASALLKKNATYCSVDPFVIFDSDPALGEKLMQAVDGYYRKGLIGPIESITAPDLAQLPQALGNFPSMVGKFVASFEEAPGSLVRMVPSAPSVQFDSNSCYVITGALGGLGQSLTQWMVDRGARNLAFLSRRDITGVPGAKDHMERLASRNVQVESFVCDVSKKDQVMRTVQQISSSRSIRGIVHAAVSYQDLTFDKLSSSQWNESLSAKVAGTKNLHEATLSMPLDFFVMTTSALSVYAFATQGAYTAANDFQDAFARYRRRMGLAASTISFSLIEEVTNVGTDSTTINLFERNKTLTLGESQFLTLVEPAFLNNRTADHTSSEQWFGQARDPLSAANLHTYLDPAGLVARKREEMASESASSAMAPRWYNDGRVSHIMRAVLDAQRQSDHLQGSLAEGPGNAIAHLRSDFSVAVGEGVGGRAKTVAFVQNAITNVVAEMLFVDVESIDATKSVAELGVDSLIAAELRNWFQQALGTNISMLDLLDPNVGISTQAETITDKALAVKGQKE
ncbi:MAG: hypothetical protein Q9168_002735 [Polycauliona sp. 1 TL-2023]